MRLKGKLLGTAVGMMLAVGPAMAQEVQLFHDKGFWSEQLQSVGDAASDAIGVSIQETPYANAEQYKAFIQASIASGETPGMFTWWTGSTFAELVSSGQIAPLDDLWATMISDGGYGAASKDLFTVDGTAYAVPLLLARWVVLYNKPLYAELGLEEPATWDELSPMTGQRSRQCLKNGQTCTPKATFQTHGRPKNSTITCAAQVPCI